MTIALLDSKNKNQRIKVFAAYSLPVPVIEII